MGINAWRIGFQEASQGQSQVMVSHTPRTDLSAFGKPGDREQRSREVVNLPVGGVFKENVF